MANTVVWTCQDSVTTESIREILSGRGMLFRIVAGLDCCKLQVEDCCRLQVEDCCWLLVGDFCRLQVVARFVAFPVCKSQPQRGGYQ